MNSQELNTGRSGVGTKALALAAWGAGVLQGWAHPGHGWQDAGVAHWMLSADHALGWTVAGVVFAAAAWRLQGGWKRRVSGLAAWLSFAAAGAAWMMRG